MMCTVGVWDLGGQCSQQYLHITVTSMAEFFSFSLWLFIFCENNKQKVVSINTQEQCCFNNPLPRQHLRMLPISLLYSDVA